MELILREIRVNKNHFLAWLTGSLTTIRFCSIIYGYICRSFSFRVKS